jgi:hypothetical protein
MTLLLVAFLSRLWRRLRTGRAPVPVLDHATPADIAFVLNHPRTRYVVKDEARVLVFLLPTTGDDLLLLSGEQSKIWYGVAEVLRRGEVDALSIGLRAADDVKRARA